MVRGFKNGEFFFFFFETLISSGRPPSNRTEKYARRAQITQKEKSRRIKDVCNITGHFNPRLKHEADGCKFLPRLQNDCQKRKLQDQIEKDGRFLSKLINVSYYKNQVKR